MVFATISPHLKDARTVPFKTRRYVILGSKSKLLAVSAKIIFAYLSTKIKKTGGEGEEPQDMPS